MEAQIYQELPFEKLVEALNPERAQSHSPVSRSCSATTSRPRRRRRSPGATLEQLPVPGWEWARFDLSIILREVAGRRRCTPTSSTRPTCSTPPRSSG